MPRDWSNSAAAFDQSAAAIVPVLVLAVPFSQWSWLYGLNSSFRNVLFVKFERAMGAALGRIPRMDKSSNKDGQSPLVLFSMWTHTR